MVKCCTNRIRNLLWSHGSTSASHTLYKSVKLHPRSTASTLEKTMRVSTWGFSHSTFEELPSTDRSSRNDAEEMQLLCTQNLAQTLSSWLHSHFLLTRTTLNLLKSWTNSSTRESGHHHAQPLWKEIGVNADNSSKQAAGTMRKNCSFCALKTLHKLCPPDCIHTFYSLVQLSTCWSRKGSGDITTHNRSEKKSVSMQTTVRSKQPERCGRTAAFVHSTPCATFVLLISFTLSTHTHTPLKLLMHLEQMWAVECMFIPLTQFVDAIALRKLARRRVSLTLASYDTTPSTHIKGGFGRCSCSLGAWRYFTWKQQGQ